MPDDRRRLAWTLSMAATLMPAGERHRFREFLNGLDGGEPPRRKIHTWKSKSKGRKPKPSNLQKTQRSRAKRRRTIDNQIPLPLE